MSVLGNLEGKDFDDYKIKKQSLRLAGTLENKGYDSLVMDDKVNISNSKDVIIMEKDEKKEKSNGKD